MRTLLILLVVFSTSFLMAQNVGIGTTNPSAFLQVQSNSAKRPSMTISDSSQFGLGKISFINQNSLRNWNLSTEASGAVSADSYFDIKSDSAHVATFRGDGRFGIRTTVPQYPLDVNGETNLRNTLRINGQAGTSGQVLTSNGTGAPEWATAAMGNSVRFSFRTTQLNANASLDSMRFIATTYNLDPTSIAISASTSRINILKSGLYHFDIYMYMEASLSSNTTTPIGAAVDVIVGTVAYPLVFGHEMYHVNPFPTNSFQYGEKFSMDLYITAGSAIKLTRAFNGAAGNFFSYGYISGYLISE